MTSKTQTLRFKQIVEAPPAEAFRAFTKTSALQDWLSQAADVDPRPGGRLCVWWESGYYANGTFSAVEPGKKLVFTWHGRGELEPTRVQVSFAARDGSTYVTVAHSGVGTGAKWKAAASEIANGWETGLENLKSVLETGIDLRIARRPMVGIFPAELSAGEAAALGLPVKGGIRLEGVIEGLGAKAAGLQRDDVIVGIGNKKVTDISTLGAALRGRQAGEEVAVTFYRNGEKQSVTMPLSGRSFPELPPDAQALAQAARGANAEVHAEFTKLLEGLSEAQAARRPVPHEWSIKEILAHFIATERDMQSWMAEMLNDGRPGYSLEFRPNVPARVAAVVAVRPTIAALLEELRCSQEETVQMLAALPEEFVARKHLYNRVASWIVQVTRGHLFEEHGDQIRLTLLAAKAQD